jgi:hypothetical protein
LRERSEQASEIWSAHRLLSRREASKVEPRIGVEVGVSVSTIDRVKTILKEEVMNKSRPSRIRVRWVEDLK